MLQECICGMQASLREVGGQPERQRKSDEAVQISQSQQQDCRMRTAVQGHHVQMFAGQKDGMLHGAVANVNPGKPSAGDIALPMAVQRDSLVRLVTGSRLRVACPPCTVSSSNSVDA